MIYWGTESFDFGHITSVRDTLSKSISTTPIVSLHTDCTFALESTSSSRYSFSFTRVTPQTIDNTSDDSTKWDNSTWMKQVIRLVDRWQTKSNGYSLSFSNDNYKEGVTAVARQYPDISANVYITELSFNYSSGTPSVVSGTVSVSVGGRLIMRGDAIGYDTTPYMSLKTDATSDRYVKLS